MIFPVIDICAIIIASVIYFPSRRVGKKSSAGNWTIRSSGDPVSVACSASFVDRRWG